MDDVKLYAEGRVNVEVPWKKYLNKKVKIIRVRNQMVWRMK